MHDFSSIIIIIINKCIYLNENFLNNIFLSLIFLWTEYKYFPNLMEISEDT